jgi:hypothetical protein
MGRLRALLRQPKAVIYVVGHAALFIVGITLMLLGSWGAAVGGSLAAAGIAGYFLFAYVLLADDVSRQLDAMRAAGLTHAFEGRSVLIKPEYDLRLSRATKCVDVIGFGLRTFRQDYGKDLKQWAKHAHIRLLLIDPTYPEEKSSIADARDIEENEARGTIRADVLQFLRDHIEVRDPNIEVRLYRCLPAINYFRVDDDIFWGPYLIGRQSRHMPTFIARRGGYLFDRLTEHFDRVWTDQFSTAAPSSPTNVAGLHPDTNEGVAPRSKRRTKDPKIG